MIQACLVLPHDTAWHSLTLLKWTAGWAELGHVGTCWITLQVAGLQESDVCTQPQVQHQKTNRKKSHHLAIDLQSVDSGITNTCCFNQLTKCWIRMAPTDTSVRKTNLNFNIVMFAAGSIAWTQLGPTWKQHATAQVSISLDVSSCCHKGSIRKTNRLIPHHLALAFSNVQGKQERQAAVDIRETRV